MTGKTPGRFGQNADGITMSDTSPLSELAEKKELEVLSRNIFERIRTQSKRKLRKKTAVYIFVLTLFCIFILAVIISIFFKVKHIKVKGSNVYESWRIVDASGIKTGENTFSIDKKAVENTIITEFPYIRSLDIVRSSPSTVTINVTEDKAAYYTILDEEYYILSDSLRVLEIVNDSGVMQARHSDLLRISVAGISKAIVGSPLEFVSDIYYSYAIETLKVFAECTMEKSITYIDCSDKFNVFFIFEDRFKIEVGNTSDLTMKLSFADSIIERQSTTAKGIINVEDQVAFFIAQNSIEFDKIS